MSRMSFHRHKPWSFKALRRDSSSEVLIGVKWPAQTKDIAVTGTVRNVQPSLFPHHPNSMSTYSSIWLQSKQMNSLVYGDRVLGHPCPNMHCVRMFLHIFQLRSQHRNIRRRVTQSHCRQKITHSPPTRPLAALHPLPGVLRLLTRCQ